MATIKLKRVYKDWDKNDGYRVLVDRLWPRGKKKEDAHLDLWLKEIAPTNELRKWFGHDPEKWESFEKKYLEEIKDNPEAANKLLNLSKEQAKITLVYGAKNEVHNQAVVLKKWLTENK